MKISLEDARVLRIKLCGLQAQAAHAAAEQKERQVSAPAATRQSAEPQTLEQAFPLLGAAMAASAGKSSTATAAPRAQAQANAPAHTAVPYEGGGELQDKARQVEQCLREPLAKLTEELDLCRRYHETTFHSKPLDRLVFIGGEARHRNICMYVARSMSLAAQVGDPLVRMGRTSDVGVESGIDRRQPQPSWSVALGLSMGPVGPEKPAATEGKKK